MRNVEIKAKVEDVDRVENIAKQLSDCLLEVIKQDDIFFHVISQVNLISMQKDNRRLKLRQFEVNDGSGELILYNRPDTEGPKLSEFTKLAIEPNQKDELIKILSESNGILGRVKKIRHLYMVGRTRIHIDRVDNLGNYMELEVGLSDEETIEQGEEIAKDLMNKLGISEDCLLKGAYLDMLLKS